jgi:hypothetical protein
MPLAIEIEDRRHFRQTATVDRSRSQREIHTKSFPDAADPEVKFRGSLKVGFRQVDPVICSPRASPLYDWKAERKHWKLHIGVLG